MLKLANCHEGEGEYFLKSVKEEDLLDLLERAEKTKLEDIKKMAIAAATLGTYSRVNPTKSGEFLSDKKEAILQIIQDFPLDFEESHQSTEYRLWYGFACQAIGQFVSQAKDATKLLQHFVDERFEMFTEIYQRAHALTEDIIEYYDTEEGEKLLEKLNKPKSLSLTKEDE